jgi:hypothetical protein
VRNTGCGSTDPLSPRVALGVAEVVRPASSVVCDELPPTDDPDDIRPQAVPKDLVLL